MHRPNWINGYKINVTDNTFNWKNEIDTKKIILTHKKHAF